MGRPPQSHPGQGESLLIFPHLFLQALEMEGSLCGPGCPFLSRDGGHSAHTVAKAREFRAGKAGTVSSPIWSGKGSHSQLPYLTQDLHFCHCSKSLCCSLPTGQTGGGREDWLPGDLPSPLHSKYTPQGCAHLLCSWLCTGNISTVYSGSC